MTFRCWSTVDKVVAAELRKRGWEVARSKKQPIIEGLVMILKARKGRWLVLASDTARLWDICLELDDAGDSTLRQHRRYLADQPQHFIGSFGYARP